ncbi:MFS transporter [Streptomyces sp. NBC_01306]|uniref:MFS transporter n=1 Tax=Streptomyces sp. NBC_01306 TaxID=2903819 RepID=UPI002255C1AC|nr:MFS transporter [Streptomyces sp. NBC_01306]MCX4726453.1 MFS transporter [Streptomyces sp. NBC_01306]
MAAAGFGTAFTMPASTAAVMEAVPAGRGGAAAAAFNAARQIGSAIGVAVFGTLVAGDFLGGLHTAVSVGAAGFLTAAVLAALLVRGSSDERDSPDDQDDSRDGGRDDSRDGAPPDVRAR